MIYLRSVAMKTRSGVESEFPFSIPAIRTLPDIEFTSPLTFFVGENGSGKSTLMEGIAAAANLPTVGSESIDSDPTLTTQRQLGRKLRLVWEKRTHRGFFLRAEDFFGFAKQVSRLRADFST